MRIWKSENHVTINICSHSTFLNVCVSLFMRWHIQWFRIYVLNALNVFCDSFMKISFIYSIITTTCSLIPLKMIICFFFLFLIEFCHTHRYSKNYSWMLCSTFEKQMCMTKYVCEFRKKWNKSTESYDNLDCVCVYV